MSKGFSEEPVNSFDLCHILSVHLNVWIPRISSTTAQSGTTMKKSGIVQSTHYYTTELYTCPNSD